VLESLIGKLSPQSNEEDNLNSCSILGDLLETKDFYNIIYQRVHLIKLIEYSFTEEENPS